MRSKRVLFGLSPHSVSLALSQSTSWHGHSRVSYCASSQYTLQGGWNVLGAVGNNVGVAVSLFPFASSMKTNQKTKEALRPSLVS